MPRPKNKLTLKQRRLVQRGINLVLGKMEELADYYEASAEYLLSRSLDSKLSKDCELLSEAAQHMYNASTELAAQFGLYETNNGNVCSNVEGV